MSFVYSDIRGHFWREVPPPIGPVYALPLPQERILYAPTVAAVEAMTTMLITAPNALPAALLWAKQYVELPIPSRYVLVLATTLQRNWACVPDGEGKPVWVCLNGAHNYALLLNGNGATN